MKVRLSAKRRCYAPCLSHLATPPYRKSLNVLAKKVKDLIGIFEEEFGQIRRNAICHNKDFDLDVVVISEPEKADDGKDYIAVEGSKSRISLEELEFEDE